MYSIFIVFRSNISELENPTRIFVSEPVVFSDALKFRIALTALSFVVLALKYEVQSCNNDYIHNKIPQCETVAKVEAWRCLSPVQMVSAS